MNLKSLLSVCKCKDRPGSSSRNGLYGSKVPDLVCSLGDSELAKRKRLLQSEIFTKTKKIEEDILGYRFYFEYSDEFLHLVTRHITIENKCCPFLRFEVQVEAKNDMVLKISGHSKQVKEFIRMGLIENA